MDSESLLGDNPNPLLYQGVLVKVAS